MHGLIIVFIFLLALAFKEVSSSDASEEEHSFVESDVKLTYFNGKGNAEVTRMMLFLSSTPFTDVRAGRDFVWAQAKAAGLHGTNLNRLPTLEYHGIEIGQTKAIERFVARKKGFLGEDPFETAMIEAIVEHVTDVRMAIRDIKARHDKDSDELKNALATFMSTKEDGGALHWVSRIESAINGEDGYCVGHHMSLADFYIHQLITYTLADADQMHLVAQHPKIAKIVDLVEGNLEESGFLGDPRFNQGEF